MKKVMRTRKRLKAILAVGLAVITVFGMTGCRKNNNQGNTGISGSGKDNVFKLQTGFKPDFSPETAVDNGEKICILGNSHYESAGDSSAPAKIKWCVATLDGSCGQSYEYSVPAMENGYQNFNCRAAFFDADETLYVPFTSMSYEDNKEEAYIYKFSSSGEMLLNEKVCDQRVNQVIKVSDTMFLTVVNETGNVLMLDNGLKVTGTIEFPTGSGYGQNFIVTDDGKIYLYGRNMETNRNEFRPVDVNAKKIGDAVIPEFLNTTGAVGMQGMLNGKGYDCYFYDGEGISGVSIETGTKEKVLNFVDSDIDISLSNPEYDVIDKEHVVLVSGNGSEKEASLYVKVDPKDVVDKEIITLGGINFGWGDRNVKSLVNRFNKTSDKYRIRILDYTQYNILADDGSYTNEGALTALRNDMTTGKAPDIIITTGVDGTLNYMQKGAFADLKPLMTNAGYNPSDYLDNIVAAGSIDDKYYVMIPQFSVASYMIKAENANANGGISLDEYMALEKKMDNVGKSMSYYSKEGILLQSLKYNSRDFMDAAGNKCNFDSDEFKKVLTLANEFPSEGASDFYKTYESNYDGYQGDRYVMCEYEINSFRSLDHSRQSHFGNQKISVCGFPNLNGDGKGIIMPSVSLAISSKCKNKEGAFTFLEMYLSPEFQTVRDNGSNVRGFPFEKKAFEAMAETAKEPYMELIDGEWVPSENNYYYFDGKNIPYTDITQETIDSVKQYVTGADGINDGNDGIINIIQEEAASYFAGQKRVDEVTGIIQSRVGIYIREKN